MKYLCNDLVITIHLIAHKTLNIAYKGLQILNLIIKFFSKMIVILIKILKYNTYFLSSDILKKLCNWF